MGTTELFVVSLVVLILGWPAVRAGISFDSRPMLSLILIGVGASLIIWFSSGEPVVLFAGSVYFSLLFAAGYMRAKRKAS